MGKGVSRKDVENTIKKVATHKATLIILVLIPLFLAFFFRLYPVGLPTTDTWAEQSMQNQIVSQYEQNLRAQYPTLPAQQLRSRAIQEYQQFREENPQQFAAQEQQLSNSFKQRLQLTLNKTDGSGVYEQTYLLAIDPYYYLRRAELLTETGDVCDEIIEGECRDDHMFAPQGRTTEATGHDYASAAFVSVAGWFGYQPITGVFYLPAIIAALAVIPAFFIAYRRYGALAGITAATIVGLHASLLGRTPAGFADTDAWNSLFPLLITLLFLLAYDSKDNKKYLWMAAAGALTGLYSWFWAGWYFSFFILLLVSIAIGGFYIAKQFWSMYKKEKPGWKTLKEPFLHAATYFVSTGIFATLFSGVSTFFNALKAPFNSAVGLQNPINANLWPNVYTTVAELNTQSLAGIINSMGGQVLFVLATLGALVYSFDAKKMTTKNWSMIAGALVYYFILLRADALALNTYMWLALYALPFAALIIHDIITGEHTKIHYGLYAIGWLLASVFATTQGTRFSLLILPVFAISIGFLVGWLLRALPPTLEKTVDIPRFYGALLVIILTVFLLATPVGGNYISNADTISKNEVPSMNDAWWNSLETIEQDSQQDAIITSWWDFGHWFKYVADRGVTFDGASQNGPDAHWVGKLLQTDDEHESAAILRMLNCGQNTAYELINEKQQDTLDAYTITTEVINRDEQEARTYLQGQGYSEQETTQILENTHCQPPQSYLIVSEDMVGKAGVWAHFGLWDFERAYMYDAYQNNDQQGFTQAVTQKLGITDAEATQYYLQLEQLPSRQAANAWISPYPSYAGQRSCARTNETITCNLALQIGEQQGVAIVADKLIVPVNNPSNNTVTLAAQGQRIDQELSVAEIILDGERYTSENGQFGLTVRIQGNTALLADKNLAESLFTELFYFEEEGTYFTELTREQQITGGKIIVYEVDWQALA